MNRSCKTTKFAEFTRMNKYGEVVTPPQRILWTLSPKHIVRGPTWGEHEFPSIEIDDWCGAWKETEKGAWVFRSMKEEILFPENLHPEHPGNASRLLAELLLQGNA